MTKRFNPDFLEVFGDWCTYVLNNMELRDWRVKLLDEPVTEAPDAAASMDFVFGRKIVSLKLAHDFFDSKEESMEHYWLHEFCHIYFEPLATLTQNGLDINMGMPAYTMFKESFTYQLEIAVDTLAYTLCDLFNKDDEYKRLLDLVFATEPEDRPAAIVEE